MLGLWQCTKLYFLRTIGCENKRGIFRIDPAKQRATFFGGGRDQRDARWWRQKRDCWRINRRRARSGKAPEKL